jgi:hypothetical protein
MIDTIGAFLHANLVVFLAVVLVPMKLIVLRLCGDSEAQSTALLAIPEDICYVSLGLILGDVATAGKAFRHHFNASSNISIDIILTAVLNVVVAVVTHGLAKWGNDHFKSFRAAGAARVPTPSSTAPQQIELPITATDENIRRIQVRHLAMFSLSYAIQIFLTIRWLAWIAKVVGNG